MRRSSLLRAAAIAALLLGSVPAQSAPKPLLVAGGRVVPVAGEPVEQGAVLVVDGRIRAVGKDAAKADGAAAAETLNFPGAVIFPGLIDAATYVGARRDRDETTSAYEFDVRVVDVLDPFHPAFAKNLAAGVTTAHVVGGDRNAVAGRSAVVKVGPDGALRVLRAEAGLKTSFDASSYPGDRAPTSPQGALEDLRNGPAFTTRMKPWRDPRSTVFATVRGDRDVQRLAAVAQAFGRPVTAMTTIAAGKFATELQPSVGGFIVEPFGPGQDAPSKRYVRDLFAGKASVAFGTWGPASAPSTLRASAAAAFAFGVEQAKIERALTLDAARLLGVDDRVGSLSPGKDGDLCVFSHSPADPRARLLLVVQDGRVVFRAPKE